MLDKLRECNSIDLMEDRLSNATKVVEDLRKHNAIIIIKGLKI